METNVFANSKRSKMTKLQNKGEQILIALSFSTRRTASYGEAKFHFDPASKYAADNPSKIIVLARSPVSSIGRSYQIIKKLKT